jgi:hypothetical protein
VRVECGTIDGAEHVSDGGGGVGVAQSSAVSLVSELLDLVSDAASAG